MWDTFWAHTNRSTSAKISSIFFLPQEAWAFGNNIEEEPQKPHVKLKKYVYYFFTDNICSASNPMQVLVSWKHVLIL